MTDSQVFGHDELTISASSNLDHEKLAGKRFFLIYNGEWVIKNYQMHHCFNALRTVASNINLPSSRNYLSTVLLLTVITSSILLQ